MVSTRDYVLSRKQRGKRKRELSYSGPFFPSSRLNASEIPTRPSSSSTATEKSTTSNGVKSPKQLHQPHHLFRSLNGSKLLDLQEHDATSDETTSMRASLFGGLKALFGAAIGVFVSKRVEQAVEISKRRKVDDSEENPFNSITPAKKPTSLPDRTTISKKALIETDIQPQLHSDKTEIDFVKSPIEWDIQKTVKQAKDQETKQNDYGTKLIRRKHKPQTSNVESQYMRAIYKGQYRSPTPKDTRPPSPATSRKQEHNIISILTKNLIREWKPKAALDDIVIIKEVKLPPPTPSKFSLKFDQTGLTFDKDFKFYQNLLKERTLQSEKITKEISEAKKPKSKLITKLTPGQEAEVVNIWKSRGKDSQVLLEALNIEVQVKDLKTLADGQWLNDVVIELFAKTLITDKIYSFNSFMFSTMQAKGYQGVQKWMKRAKVQISKLDLILCPINVHQTHWVLGAINLKQKKILYLDSLSTRTNTFSLAALDLLEDFLKGETKKQGVPELGQGFTKEHILDCPQQQNGYDCGVFTLLNSFYLSKNAELTYQPAEAKDFRRVIAYTILQLTK